jgi:Bacterial capsule synthesis protein PGA_cap
LTQLHYKSSAFNTGNVNLTIGGDICPMNRHLTALIDSDTSAFLGGLDSELRESDYNIFNLEGPLIDRESPIVKEGTTLGARVESVNGLVRLPVHAVTLANNHLRDHGDEGVLSTLRVLSENSIRFFGGGEDLATASRIQIVEVKNVRIGLLGIADREFSIASETRPGACPIDEIGIHRAITSRKGDWDILLVMVHAGHHLYQYPSPWLQRLCRWLVDLGATAVVCQHSHCAGSIEKYENGLIVYGQGNFLFDWIPDPGQIWNEGFLLRLEMSQKGLEGWAIIPYVRSANSGRILRLEGLPMYAFMADLEARSRETQDGCRVQNRWLAYCREMELSYLALLKGNSSYGAIRRQLQSRLGVSWKPFSKKQKVLLGNLVRCADHREVLESILFAE